MHTGGTIFILRLFLFIPAAGTMYMYFASQPCRFLQKRLRGSKSKSRRYPLNYFTYYANSKVLYANGKLLWLQFAYFPAAAYSSARYKATAVAGRQWNFWPALEMWVRARAVSRSPDRNIRSAAEAEGGGGDVSLYLRAFLHIKGFDPVVKNTLEDSELAEAILNLSRTLFYV